MRIVFLRNAEHALYAAQCWPVDTTGLSPNGMVQSKRLFSSLANTPIVAVYSSPTVRAVETIRLLAEDRGLAIEQATAFKALDMGECTGMTYEKTREITGSAAWAEVLSNPKPDMRYFKNGETLDELANRAWRELERIVEEHESEDDVVVISTHEEVIGALLCKMADMPLSWLWWWGGRLRPPLYASITEVLWKNGKWKLIHFGCTKHLEGS